MSETHITLPDSVTIGELEGISAAWSTEYAGPLSFDASQVEAIDCAGFQMILSYTREHVGRGHTVEWQSVSAKFSEVAEMLNMTSVLGLKST